MHPKHTERLPWPLARGVQITPERAVLVDRTNEFIIVRVTHARHFNSPSGTGTDLGFRAHRHARNRGVPLRTPRD